MNFKHTQIHVHGMHRNTIRNLRTARSHCHRENLRFSKQSCKNEAVDNQTDFPLANTNECKYLANVEFPNSFFSFNDSVVICVCVIEYVCSVEFLFQKHFRTWIWFSLSKCFGNWFYIFLFLASIVFARFTVGKIYKTTASQARNK